MEMSVPVRALLTAMMTAWPTWQLCWPCDGATNPPRVSPEMVRTIARWRRFICPPLDKATYHYPLTVRRSRVALGRQLVEGADHTVGADGAVGQAGTGSVEPDPAQPEALGAGDVE